MPRRERSAGFVLYRRGAGGERAYLLLDYGRHWDYAKGHVEPGEDDLAAARRELAEETGLRDARVDDRFAHEIEYYFRSAKHGMIQKQVRFFLAETTAADADVALSHEHVGFAFLGYDAALQRVTFPTARAVLREAERFLRDLKDAPPAPPAAGHD